MGIGSAQLRKESKSPEKNMAVKKDEARVANWRRTYGGDGGGGGRK